MRLRSLLGDVRPARNQLLPLSSHVYDPLPSESSIRLLRLNPPRDKVVRCSLQVFELQDAPAFRALSYTWGPSDTIQRGTSKATKQPFVSCTVRRKNVKHKKRGAAHRPHQQHIICDDQFIRVTSNLRDALQMLRDTVNISSLPQNPSYYWVDALCVNQDNVLERNVQVARMADIFRAASGVVVWLGREDQFTADALQVIHKVSAVPEESWSSVSYTSFFESGTPESSSKPSLTYTHWLAFIALVNRSWFMRAWVSVVAQSSSRGADLSAGCARNCAGQVTSRRLWNQSILVGRAFEDPSLYQGDKMVSSSTHRKAEVCPRVA